MDILAPIFSALGLISMILASVIGGEKMKRILVLVFLGNLFVGLSYIFDGTGINGAASCFLGAVQSVISYFFNVKHKPLPKWLVALYALSFVVVNVAVMGELTVPAVINTSIAIVATLAFVMGIIQTKGFMYRFWTVMNMLLWCVFDIVAKSYPSLPTHVILFVFMIAGMIIHDRKAIKELKSGEK